MENGVTTLDTELLVFGSVFAVANRLQRVLDAAMPEVTAKQWWLLATLSQFDEPPTLSELSKAADTSHQNTRQILDKLARKGFVTLVPDGADRRVSRVATTEKLDEWGRATEGQARDFMAQLYAGFTRKELIALGNGLMRLHDTLGHMTKEKE
ncbi:MarR family winged helix-turn-helix transcriptional regulator [Ancrocorticia populi]|nr:MarR family transcriptional regulator [Ancrocorticia populi]